MAQFPQKMSLFATALQTQRGVAAATPTIVWPRLEVGGPSAVKNVNYIHWADNRAGEAFFTDRGTWYEGDVSLPIVPGYLGGAGGLIDILCTRDAAWQGKWFSCWEDIGANYRRQFVDCKTRSFNLKFTAGEEPSLSATIGGLSQVAGLDLSSYDPIAIEPYMVKEISAELGEYGGAYAATCIFKSIDISVDNNCTSFEDEMRICGTNPGNPHDQPNFMGQIVEGSAEAEFSDATLIEAFEELTVMKLKITLARAGIATAIIEIPRLHIGANPLKGGGASGMVMQDGIQFHGLYSGTDYATSAIVVTETTP